MPYTSRIESNAERFGYKAANLMHLSSELENDKSTRSIKTKIPPFSAISHQNMMEFLDTNSPEWKGIFKEFTSLYKEQSKNSTALSEQAKNTLSRLRSCIENCFINHPINKSNLGEVITSMNDEDLVMVRSTGREDSTSLSNPGGNDSFPCKVKDIGATLGRVIASYFGERSLQQRLDADDDITADPFCPVLVQSMIRETENKQVISGVIYGGDDGSARIQAAPGHGELVVNSKGNVDDYYISPNGIIYSEIKSKNSRIISQWDEESKSTKLVFAQNDLNSKNNPSLDEDVVFRLHELSNQIQSLYEMRMDIEFVYDTSENAIFVVQARAITEGKRANLTASSVAPENIIELNDKHRIGRGQVITPDVNTALVIHDSSEIIICQTIGEALDKYQKSSTKPKAVIVQREAAINSHEAGEFSKNAVAVLQLDNIKAAESYLEKGSIIIDPQRKSAFHISRDSGIVPESLIREGIFSSTLSSQVTSNKALNWASPEPSEGKNKSRREIVINGKELGILLQEAKKGDNEATKNLLSFLHKIAYSDEFFLNNEEQVDKKTIPQALETLSTPSYLGDNKLQKESLARSLRYVANQYKNGKISREIFQQIFISGGEIFLMLDEMEKASKGSKDYYEEVKEEVKEGSDYKAIEPLTYLNSLEKFTGLFKSLPKKGTLSESLVTQLQEKKHKDKVTNSNPNLSGDSLQYYLETTKLSKFLIKEEHRQNWIEFCAEICADEEKAKALGTIVGIVVENNIHQDWINIIFTEALEKDGADNDKILLALKESLPSEEKFAQFNLVNAELEKMNSQISSWGEPQSFYKLYPNFKDSLAIINQNLQYNPQDSAVERIVTRQKAFELIDVMDGTIKKVMKSNSYKSGEDQNPEEYQQQCRHSKALVGEFFEIMKSWNEYTDFEHKDYVIRKMGECFEKQLESPFKENLLSISGKFFVNATTIDTPSKLYGFNEVFVKSGEQKECSYEKGQFQGISLEDFFTTVHQSSINSVLNLSRKDVNQEKYTDLSPQFVKNIGNKICDKIKENSIMGRKLNPELLYLKKDYPYNSLCYNVALGCHSASIEVKHNINDNKENAKICFNAYGFNEANRWDISSLIANYLVETSDPAIKFTQKPCISNNNFSFEIFANNDNQVDELASLFSNIIEISFYQASREFFTGDASRITKLLKTNPKTLEKLYDAFKSSAESKQFLSSNLEFIKLCVPRKNDLSEGLTAASILVQKNTSSFLESLVNKADKSALETQNSDGTTIFSHVRDFKIFKILYEKGLLPKEEDKENVKDVLSTALANLLSKVGVDLNDSEKPLQKILSEEVNKSEYEAYTNLIEMGREAGIDLNDFKERLQKILSEEVKKSEDRVDIELIKTILEAGVDLNDFGAGLTAASLLVQNTFDNSKLLKLPIKAFSAENQDGTTAFSQIKNIQQFIILYDPSKGGTPSENDKEHLQEILLKEVNKDGYKNITGIKAMLEAGFDVPSTNQEGLTVASFLVKNTDHPTHLSTYLLVLPIEVFSAENQDGTTVFSHVKDSRSFQYLHEKGLLPTENDKKHLQEILLEEVNKDGYKRSITGIKAMLEAGFDVPSTNQEGLTVASFLVKNTNYYSFQELLELPITAFSAENQDGTTAFSQVKNLEEFKILYSSEIKPNAKDKEKIKSLLEKEILGITYNPVFFEESKNKIEFILQSGIDIDKYCKDGNRRTPIEMALENRNYDLASFLAEKGFYLTQENRDFLKRNLPEVLYKIDGTTAFSQIKYSQSFKTLHEKGLQPAENDGENLAKILAKEIGESFLLKDELKYLIKNSPEAIKNYKDEAGNTFATMAANKNNPKLLILLAENGFDCSSPGNEGLTPFATMVKNGLSFQLQDLMKIIEPIKDRMFFQNQDGTTAFSQIKDSQSFKTLHEKGLQPAENDDENLVKILAKEIGESFLLKDELKYLIKNSPEAIKNYKDEAGNTFATMAANKKNSELLILLAENGFDCSSPGNEGLTPFATMVKNGSSYQLQALMERGEPIKDMMLSQNKDGTTALSHIRSANDFETLLEVIKPSGYDWMALHNIAKKFIEENRAWEVIKMVELGLDIKAEYDGKTIENLLVEKGVEDYNLRRVQNAHNDRLPETIESRINIIASAIVSAAIESENFSGKARIKLASFTDKVAESLKEEYGSNIKKMKQDFNLHDLSEIENPITINQNIRDLGNELVRQIGTRESLSKFNISCIGQELRTINEVAMNEFKFSVPSASINNAAIERPSKAGIMSISSP